METGNPVKAYLAEIGRRGGQKSRRRLSTGEARQMVLIREAKRTYRKFRHVCFWSYKDSLDLSSLTQIDFVIRVLKKNGGRDAWFSAAKLQKMVERCR